MDTRLATLEDLAALTAIYNHYVESSPATFHVDPFAVEARRDWFGQFDGERYQCWVAEENARLLAELETQDLHRAYGGVVQPNEASARLHESFGFREVARYSEVGRKFGRYWDVVWYERPLL